MLNILSNLDSSDKFKNIPILQLSLPGLSFAPENVDTEMQVCLELGQRLKKLREKNILIVGSGFTFHNMKAFFASKEEVRTKFAPKSSAILDILESMGNKAGTVGSSAGLTKEFSFFPNQNPENFSLLQTCHPRLEHLYPLIVCMGSQIGGSGNDFEENSKKLKSSCTCVRGRLGSIQDKSGRLNKTGLGEDCIEWGHFVFS